MNGDKKIERTLEHGVCAATDWEVSPTFAMLGIIYLHVTQPTNAS